MSLLSLSKRLFGKREKAPAPKKRAAAGVAAKPRAKRTAPAGPVPSRSLAKASQINLQLLLTEKAMDQQADTNVLTFRVVTSANKRQIAAAVREKYGVVPLSVRTVINRPKPRQRGNIWGHTTSWKKAFVTVDDIKGLNLGP